MRVILRGDEFGTALVQGQYMKPRGRPTGPRMLGHGREEPPVVELALTRAIEAVNAKEPVEPGSFSIYDDDAVLSVCWSGGGGSVLASISTAGHVKLWQVSARRDRQWRLLRVLRDPAEGAIDEFFTGTFLGGAGVGPGGRALFAAAGKRKDRHRWDAEEGDNAVLPGQVKVFDAASGACVLRLGPGGHTEEILHVASRTVGDANYLLSCGQDGRLCRWHLDRTWTRLLSVRSVRLGDMAFHVDCVCAGGRELVLAAVDEEIKIVELGTLRVLGAARTGFSSYCDWAKVLRVDEAAGRVQLVLRGVELLSTDTLAPSAPNCILVAELDVRRGYELTVLRRLQHPAYQANSWLLRPGLTPNGHYLAAPTAHGRVLVFSLATGHCTALLHHHADSEVRQVAFHPRLPLLVSCGDDAHVRIYFAPQPPQ